MAHLNLAAEQLRDEVASGAWLKRRGRLRHGGPWLGKPLDPNELESVVAEALAGSLAPA